MSDKPFFQFAWYPYKSGQESLIQYTTTTLDGNPFPNSNNERFDYGHPSSGVYTYALKDKTDITPADYANQSMYAVDLKNSLGKTCAVFTSHFVGFGVASPDDIKGHYIDSSVGKFTDDGRIKIFVDTFGSDGESVVLINSNLTVHVVASYINNVRS